MELDRFLDPFRQPEFETGLEHALVPVLVMMGLGVLWRWKLSRPVPVAGLVIAAATLGAIDATTDLVLTIAVLAAGGVLVDLVTTRWRLPWAVITVCALPGAVLLVRVEVASSDGMGVLLASVLLLGAPLLGDVDRRWSSRCLGPVLALGTVGAAYSTVPDTELVLVLLATTGAAAVGAWPLQIARIGYGGSFAFVGTLCVVVAIDGAARDRAVVAGVACLGLAYTEPLISRLGFLRDRPQHDLTDAAALVVIHVAVALACARLAGLRPTAGAAAVGSIIAIAAGGGAWMLWLRYRVLAMGPRDRSPADQSSADQSPADQSSADQSSDNTTTS